MPYEVTKTINGRPYRYRVERVRDEATGRMRSRWTYLGRGDGAAPPRRAKPRTSDVRERILDAVETLLATTEYDDLTADAIARAAGIAHGTFYRHFRDKRDALDAAIERLRATRVSPLSHLDDGVTTLAAARANVRALALAVLRAPASRPGLLRAYYVLSLREAEYAAARRARAAELMTRFGEHIAALRVRGLATASDPAATAAVLFAILEGYYREGVLDGVPIDDERIAAALEAVDRAIFGSV